MNGNNRASRRGGKKAQRRTENALLPKSVKTKPETRDACVMTDIQFGTECVSELSPLCQSQIDAISLNDSPAKGFSNGRSSHRYLPPIRNRSSSSPCPPKQDKCTSPLIPKLALRNGIINRLSMNGGAAPTPQAAPKNTRQRKRTKRKPPPPRNYDNSSSMHHQITLPTEGPLPSEDYLIQIHEKAVPPLRKKLGSGKHGSHSFLVSIPRVHCSEKLTATSTSLSKTSSRGHKKFGHRFVGHRRRTEIQLLLDGDKPREERLRVDQVPKFTAEDVTSWSAKSSWLGSGTRKIIPVEHLSYPPLSPSPKRLSSVGSNSSLNVANHRKRSHSEDSDNSNIISPKLPSQKNLRLTSPSDSLLSRQQAPLLDGETDGMITIDQDSTCSEVFSNAAVEHTMGALDTSECLKVVSNDVFCGELVAFDSRGDCLLDDGEYTIIMQKCLEGDEKEASDLLMFEPLTWSSVFSAPEQVSVCVSDTV